MVLKRGSDGVTVDWVQKRINEIMAAGLDDDGKFGPATEAAVKDQQARAGLVVDGLCGPKTISSLL